MREWRNVTLGELCATGLANIQTGPFGSQLHAYDYVERGVPVVPTEAIGDRRIDHNVLPQINKAKAVSLARHLLRSGDILFARRRVQATGRSAIVRDAEDGFICGTGAIRLRLSVPVTRVLPEFLSHVLSAQASIDWFKFHAIGATMPNLNEGIIKLFALALPPPPEQRAIACILDALDDKIDLNRRMNEALEAMARAIFKDWFVDFGPTRAKVEGRVPYLAPNLWALFPNRMHDKGKPEGWEVCRLGDIARNHNRVCRPKEIAAETAYVALEHMPRRSIALSQWSYADSVESNKLRFQRGEFLFGKLRPYFHKVGIAPLDGVCTTDAVVVGPTAPEWASIVLMTLSSDEFVNFTDQGSTGTKMPRTSWREMSEFVVTRSATPDLALALNDLVTPMMNRLIANIHEARTLSTTRDLLLPRLMSGELHVREAERVVEAAL